MHPPDASEALSPRRLRRAFGRFATGVTIVTCEAEDGTLAGLTANSFGSLSLEPPLVQWSLRLDSAFLGAFSRASHFAVNVLAATQVDLSQRFASASEHRFAHGLWSRGLGGAPLLAGCTATFECARLSQHEFGDHLLFVGRVLRAEDVHTAPLLFESGRYHRLGAAI